MIDTHYEAVEFRGGPQDGLRLVEVEIIGVEAFRNQDAAFAVDGSDAKYRVTEVVNGVLWLDYLGPEKA